MDHGKKPIGKPWENGMIMGKIMGKLLCLMVFMGKSIGKPWENEVNQGLPFGKRLQHYGNIHHFLWENSLFQWPFSIAILYYQGVLKLHGFSSDYKPL